MFIRSKALLLLFVALPIVSGCVAAVAVGGTATGATVAIDPRTAGTIVEDEAIELKAVKQLLSDEQLRDQSHINVTSYNNIVLLTGEATSEQTRTRVIEMIRDIPKVRHIHNEITIAAPSSMLSRSSDTVITGEIKSRLVLEQDIRGRAVKVVTENGIVYLMGLVTDAEAEGATAIAREVGGVQAVVTLFEKVAPEN